jgi:hypothetical protein
MDFAFFIEVLAYWPFARDVLAGGARLRADLQASGVFTFAQGAMVFFAALICVPSPSVAGTSGWRSPRRSR